MKNNGNPGLFFNGDKNNRFKNIFCIFVKFKFIESRNQYNSVYSQELIYYASFSFWDSFSMVENTYIWD